jgi:hypothetical protein
MCARRQVRLVRCQPLTSTSAAAPRFIASTPGTIAISDPNAAICVNRSALPRNARGHTVGTSSNSAITITAIDQR